MPSMVEAGAAKDEVRVEVAQRVEVQVDCVDQVVSEIGEIPEADLVVLATRGQSVVNTGAVDVVLI